MSYNIKNNSLPNLFLNLKENLENKKEYIENLVKIDNKYCAFDFDINILKNIIDELKNEKISGNIKQTILIHYNGNPYLTLNLSIFAILTKTTLFLEFDEYMLGINTFITQNINEILKKFETEDLIHVIKRKDKLNLNPNKIICIDDINKYNEYLYKKKENVYFWAFDYIDFYCDSENFEELTELIYKYGENNLIAIDSYSEFKVNEAIEMIKSGYGKKVVLLTDNEETKERFSKEMQTKEIYINKNPFKNKEYILNKKILSI